MGSSPSGLHIRQTSTKRPRSSGSSAASGLCVSECLDDAYTDNMRSQKRFLSEVMATNMRRLNMSKDSRQGAVAEPSCHITPMEEIQTEIVCSPTKSGRSDYSAACSMRSQETETSSCPSGFSPMSGPHTRNAMKSPRQKGRHRTSPLRGGLPYPKSPRYFSSAGGRHLGRLAPAIEATDGMPLSPSDPHTTLDLRRTALLRSVLQRREGSPSTLTQGSLAESIQPSSSLVSSMPEWEALGTETLPEAVRSRSRMNDAATSPSCVDVQLGSAFMHLGFASPAVKRKLEATRLGDPSGLAGDNKSMV